MASKNKIPKKTVSAKKGGGKEVEKDDIKSEGLKLINIIYIRLKCIKLVMKHGTGNDIDNPDEKADKIFNWVMKNSKKETQSFSDLYFSDL